MKVFELRPFHVTGHLALYKRARRIGVTYFTTELPAGYRRLTRLARLRGNWFDVAEADVGAACDKSSLPLL